VPFTEEDKRHKHSCHFCSKETYHRLQEESGSAQPSPELTYNIPLGCNTPVTTGSLPTHLSRSNLNSRPDSSRPPDHINQTVLHLDSMDGEYTRESATMTGGSFRGMYRSDSLASFTSGTYSHNVGGPTDGHVLDATSMRRSRRPVLSSRSNRSTLTALSRPCPSSTVPVATRSSGGRDFPVPCHIWLFYRLLMISTPPGNFHPLIVLPHPHIVRFQSPPPLSSLSPDTRPQWCPLCPHADTSSCNWSLVDIAGLTARLNQTLEPVPLIARAPLFTPTTPVIGLPAVRSRSFAPIGIRTSVPSNHHGSGWELKSLVTGRRNSYHCTFDAGGLEKVGRPLEVSKFCQLHHHPLVGLRPKGSPGWDVGHCKTRRERRVLGTINDFDSTSIQLSKSPSGH